LRRHGSKLTDRIRISAPIVVAADDADWAQAMRALNGGPCRSLTLAAPLHLQTAAYGSLALIDGLERFSFRSLKCSNRIIKNVLRPDTSSQLLEMDLSGISDIFRSGVSMAAIRQMTRLESLHFDDAGLNNLEIMIPMVSESYSLVNYSARDNPNVAQQYYIFDCTCTRLRSLQLANTSIDNTALLSILTAAQSSLQLLDISQTHVTSTIWSVSPALPQLATLCMAKTAVDEEGWALHLLQCAPRLHSVDVSYMTITDDIISLLQTRAERIVADGCRGVSRATRSHLRSLSGSK
jgi:hypothetical protein